LRKGYSIIYGMELIYFDAEKVLSKETLPFGCSTMNYVAKRISKISTEFLKEEDFIIK